MGKTYRFQIDCVERGNGNRPGKEFYDGLAKPVKAKFVEIWQRIERSATGTIGDTNKFEKLKGKHAHDLWEMKVWYMGMWYRMLCFRDGPKWMITHGFTKKENGTPRNEIDAGVGIKREYEERNRRRTKDGRKG